ncbi:MAG: rhomboid family intramembrane serine protease [Thermoplasmatales archaeon]|nr:MAG: rhomboid family intramembrane serine protease [Thermoplasmatales archaeon]
MDIVVLEIDLVSIIAICIMIGSLVVAYAKKWMMTYALMVANFAVFILSIIFYKQTFLGGVSVIIWDLGFRPIYLSIEFFPQIYTLFTSMFVHGGFAHIIGNMIIFFFLGMAFEQRIGAKKFLIIYLITGVCGALTHSLLNIGSAVTLIGASGAIFGIMGAFAFSYPRDEVVMPIPLGIIMLLRRVKVIYAVILFAALETVIVMFDVQDNTAHFAHLGGLISGFVLAAILIGRKKTHTEKGQTIYYDSYKPISPSKIDYGKMRKLATTPELKEMLNRVESETVPQVRDVWVEHFFERAKCPKCSNSLNHFDKKVWCEHCGFRSSY